LHKTYTTINSAVSPPSDKLRKLREQERESRREYLDRESHYAWGKRYLLSVVEADAPPSLVLSHGHMVLKTRPGANDDRKNQIVEEWYRDQIRQALPALISRWEPILGVTVDRIFVQRMKTRWGSCNPAKRNIRLNTDLAKKPPECLEYIVVHEMAHLIEPTHNARFIELMDRLMPNWRFRRERLNELPVRHEEWGY